MNSKDLLPSSWFELHDLLLANGPYVFHEFLKIFGGGFFHYYEDDTGIRIHNHWPTGPSTPEKLNDMDDGFSIHDDTGFVYYTFTKSTDPFCVAKEYKRFLKLKAFL